MIQDIARTCEVPIAMVRQVYRAGRVSLCGVVNYQLIGLCEAIGEAYGKIAGIAFVTFSAAEMERDAVVINGNDVPPLFVEPNCATVQMITCLVLG